MYYYKFYIVLFFLLLFFSFSSLPLSFHNFIVQHFLIWDELSLEMLRKKKPLKVSM